LTLLIAMMRTKMAAHKTRSYRDYYLTL
jgi:hypothetical protein